MAAVFGRAGNQQEEEGHAHGDAVSDLLENAGLGAVGDFRRDFAAAIHGARMQNERIGLRVAEALGVELIAENVVFVGNGWFVHAFGLHAKHEDHVGIFESFFEFENAADRDTRRADFLEFAWNPHRRAAQREAAAKFSEEMNVGARDAAVLEVAEDGDIEIVDLAEAVANSERVEKALRGMFVSPVAGIDNRNVEMASDKISGARRSVTHDQAIGLHCIERLHGV